MKFIKVTDTKGRIWHLNSDWILRMSEDQRKRGTEIEFAIHLSPSVNLNPAYTEGLLMTIGVKESVSEVRALIEGNEESGSVLGQDSTPLPDSGKPGDPGWI